jgi:hypothetical protein
MFGFELVLSSPLLSPPTISSKIPLPCMSLRVRDKESQRHPGKPDQAPPRRSSQQVQADNAKKISVQAEREDRRAQSIRAVAEVETQMGEQLQEKLTAAHHPPPSTKKKVPRARIKTLGAAPSTALTGKGKLHSRTHVEH